MDDLRARTLRHSRSTAWTVQWFMQAIGAWVFVQRFGETTSPSHGMQASPRILRIELRPAAQGGSHAGSVGPVTTTHGVPAADARWNGPE
jgi:hypothetical protein